MITNNPILAPDDWGRNGGRGLGGYITVRAPAPGGVPAKKNLLPWLVPGEAGMTKQSGANPGEASSGSVKTGFGLKQTPMGQFSGIHPNMVGAARRNFGI